MDEVQGLVTVCGSAVCAIMTLGVVAGESASLAIVAIAVVAVVGNVSLVWLAKVHRDHEHNAESSVSKPTSSPTLDRTQQQVMKTVVQPPQWQRRQGVDWLKLPTLDSNYLTEADGVGGHRLVSR
jgi:hypothetical protein